MLTLGNLLRRFADYREWISHPFSPALRRPSIASHAPCGPRQ